MDERFTVESARQAAHTDRLKEWVRDFLTASQNPNHGLWDAVANRAGLWVGPLEVPIEMCTPGGSRIHDERVEQIVAAAPPVENLPPILVRWRWHQKPNGIEKLLLITDGNHRHAALMRLKHQTCWVLLELRTEDLAQ